VPAEGLPVVLEGGTVKIEVFCFSDILRLTTGTGSERGLEIKSQNLPGPDGWLGVGVNPLIGGDFLGFWNHRLFWFFFLNGDIFDDNLVVI